MTHNEELCVTHALLMDDDIVIEPEALVKTYQILTLLKMSMKMLLLEERCCVLISRQFRSSQELRGTALVKILKT